jgi:hypothetical protein
MKLEFKWKEHYSWVLEVLVASLFVCGSFYIGYKSNPGKEKKQDDTKYVMVQETYGENVMSTYKAKVLEEFDGCYKVHILNYRWSAIEPDTVWVLKNGTDSGKFKVLFESVWRDSQIIVSTQTCHCEFVAKVDNGGTLPTSHRY